MQVAITTMIRRHYCIIRVSPKYNTNQKNKVLSSLQKHIIQQLIKITKKERKEMYLICLI